MPIFFREEILFEEKFQIGGQAIIEGVMFRGKNLIATAVRKSDGSIALKTRNARSISDRFPIFKLPFIRGNIALFESLKLGMKSFQNQLTDSELKLTLVFSILLPIGFFIVIPTFAADFFKRWNLDLNFIEGLFRIGILLVYFATISRMKALKRLLKYHGAEHKTINCYESGLKLTIENVRKQSRFHHRCGTSFLLISMLVSIFVFSLLDWSEIWIRIFSRILLLPIVVGISYELIRATNPVVKFLTLPGIFLQYLTTLEPDDCMLEVSITSLNAVKE